jgi:lactonase
MEFEMVINSLLTGSTLSATAAGSTLSHTGSSRGLVPIPASERDLVTVTATPYVKLSDGLMALEGPAFDRQGNLYFVDVFAGKIHRLSPDQKLTTVLADASSRKVC